MLTKTPLKQLVKEAAQLHSSLTCNRAIDIKRSITSVAHTITARYEYKQYKQGE